jgi:hypothetical protein
LPHLTSEDIGARIEELYGAPLNDLHAYAQSQPPGMLAALLGSHQRIVLAEQSIRIQRERLRHLLHPQRPLNAHQVSHILDGARRLAEAVAVRDTQAATAQAVLRSLGRATAPNPSADSAAAALPTLPTTPAGAAASR